MNMLQLSKRMRRPGKDKTIETENRFVSCNQGLGEGLTPKGEHKGISGVPALFCILIVVLVGAY